ncbi:MAG TPA: STM4011 family radical SAM protein [Tahibacter sp.]|nr:STM4011 family radical SAM protein [Tahibacter sp.]
MRRVDDATLRVLYRGRLASCNYDCAYCPFAKRRDTRETLRRDAADLARFVDWALASREPLAILFTPWGEGLVRKPYIEALVALSHAPHVRRVAIQTNLSSNLAWLGRADRDALALWCTYHPSQVSRTTFLARVAKLRDAGVRFSVGVVGAREHFAEIDAVRAALADGEYLWINALDPRPDGYYAADDVARLAAIDPHFAFNLAPPASLGADCRAGSTAISVDGDGNVRPCHFVRRDLGNLYDGTFAQKRSAAACPNARCECFIGYVHRRDVAVSAAFGDGVMERVLAL